LKDKDFTKFYLIFTGIKLIRNGYEIKPSIIVIDCDRACLNVLDEVFPYILSLICRWHINKDILAEIQSKGGAYKQLLCEDNISAKDLDTTKQFITE
jgi:hypothetical protein